ncbi:MAG: hypothetical protein ABI690_01935 [Chloroflexota bacterium]
MPIQIVWENPEHSVARFEIVGKWTWEEFYLAYGSFWDEIAESDQQVDAIVDVTRTSGIPSGAFNQVRQYANKRPKHPGIIVLAGANGFLTAFMETTQKLFRSMSLGALPVQFAKTLAEAQAIIAEKQTERSL